MKEWYCHNDKESMSRAEALEHLERGHEIESSDAFFGLDRVEIDEEFVNRLPRAEVFASIFGRHKAFKRYIP